MTEDFVRETCQPGRPECCRYLAMGMDGWRCLKLSTLRPTIDAKVDANEMRARGDNCPGI